jgi:hypothetical protein
MNEEKKNIYQTVGNLLLFFVLVSLFVRADFLFSSTNWVSEFKDGLKKEFKSSAGTSSFWL